MLTIQELFCASVVASNARIDKSKVTGSTRCLALDTDVVNRCVAIDAFFETRTLVKVPFGSLGIALCTCLEIRAKLTGRIASSADVSFALKCSWRAFVRVARVVLLPVEWKPVITSKAHVHIIGLVSLSTSLASVSALEAPLGIDCSVVCEARRAFQDASLFSRRVVVKVLRSELFGNARCAELRVIR